MLNNVNIYLIQKKFAQKFYTATKTLPITQQEEFNDNKKFAKVVLDKKSEIFVVYIKTLKTLLSEIIIHLF